MNKDKFQRINITLKDPKGAIILCKHKFVNMYHDNVKRKPASLTIRAIKEHNM